MKNAIKQILFKIIYNSNYKFFMRDYILMESNPDFMDNDKAVFDELIKRNINEKYKIIWLVKDYSKVNNINIKNVYFIERKNKFKCLKYRIFAKYIIDCNEYIKKINKYQYRIYLQHGLPLKYANDYTEAMGEVNNFITSADFFKKPSSELYRVNIDDIVITGMPRNDWLFDEKNSLHICDEIERKKTILWLPTFRNHKLANTNYKAFNYGIPLFESEEDFKRINETLKNNETLLLIKLHPAENVQKILELKLSNIVLINDNIFFEKQSNLYRLLVNTDALITDYSSVYFDYLLTGKQIGLAIPDIDDYTKNVGFIYNDYYDVVKGEYMYKLDDLNKFIYNIANNNDPKKNEREEVTKKYHKYIDGNSSKRVVDFILSKIEGDKK